MATRISNARACDYYRRWMYSNAEKLPDIYASYSDAKRRAWQYCEDLCLKHNGRRLRIVGHNCMTFTAAFEGCGPCEGDYGIWIITRTYDYFHAYDDGMHSVLCD